jgi:hypothetical protein
LLDKLLDGSAIEKTLPCASKDRLRQAGFQEIRTEPLGDVHTAVIGIKAA